MLKASSAITNGADHLACNDGYECDVRRLRDGKVLVSNQLINGELLLKKDGNTDVRFTVKFEDVDRYFAKEHNGVLGTDRSPAAERIHELYLAKEEENRRLHEEKKAAREAEILAEKQRRERRYIEEDEDEESEPEETDEFLDEGEDDDLEEILDKDALNEDEFEEEDAMEDDFIEEDEPADDIDEDKENEDMNYNEEDEIVEISSASLKDTLEAVGENTSIIGPGVEVNGDISSPGALIIKGTVNGNLKAADRIEVSGRVNGDSDAAKIIVMDKAEIHGGVKSSGLVKIGSSSNIFGNVSASDAQIAGAIKGNMDISGELTLENTAVIKGDIKSKVMRMAAGAVIAGQCVQCYAEENADKYFEKFPAEDNKSRKKNSPKYDKDEQGIDLQDANGSNLVKS